MSNLTDVMFPPVNYGHTNARISTMSVAQDSQFNDVAFWSNSPGIIESEEERDGDGTSSEGEDDLGALSDNSDFEYFGGNDGVENDEHHEVTSMKEEKTPSKVKMHKEAVVDKDFDSGGDAGGGSGDGGYVKEEKHADKNETIIRGNDGDDDDDDDDVNRKEKSNSLNLSIDTIAGIVAGESLNMSSKDKERKEKELLQQSIENNNT